MFWICHCLCSDSHASRRIVDTLMVLTVEHTSCPAVEELWKALVGAEAQPPEPKSVSTVLTHLVDIVRESERFPTKHKVGIPSESFPCCSVTNLKQPIGLRNEQCLATDTKELNDVLSGFTVLI